MLAFLYIIFKYIQSAFQLMGIWPKSKREKGKEEEDRLKNQYYYYCKMNPEGFERLKLEADEKMAKARTANQAAILK